MRDSQRGKVYKSERQYWHPIKSQVKTYNNIEEAQKDLAWMVGQLWFKKRFNKKGFRKYTVEQAGHSWNWCHDSGSFNPKITLNKNNGLYRWVLVHELAHAVSPSGEHHGAIFCKNYLELVGHFIGHEQASGLKASMKKNGVKTSVRKKRTITPEQLEVLRARITKAREAKALKSLQEATNGQV